MRRILALLVLVALMSGAAVAQDEEPLNVGVSFSIIGDVVQAVGNERVAAFSIIPIGGDPHSYEPDPRELAVISNVDVMFVNGANFEESILEILENAGDVPFVELSACVPLSHHEDEAHEEEHNEEGHSEDVSTDASALSEMCARHAEEIEALHADADHADHSEEGDHAVERLYQACGEDGHEGEKSHSEESGDAHDHGECDPHVWSDPHNVIYWVLMIRDTLVEMDPANADYYAANASAYIEELESLVEDFILPSVESIPAEQRVLVTNHETLNYFAAEYGFEVVGTVLPSMSTVAEPSAADIAQLIDVVRERNVQAIFAENTVGTSLAEQVAAETGVQFFRLYTDSLGDPVEGPASYLDYIRTNVSTIVTALGGTPAQ